MQHSDETEHTLFIICAGTSTKRLKESACECSQETHMRPPSPSHTPTLLTEDTNSDMCIVHIAGVNTSLLLCNLCSCTHAFSNALHQQPLHTYTQRYCCCIPLSSSALCLSSSVLPLLSLCTHSAYTEWVYVRMVCHASVLHTPVGIRGYEDIHTALHLPLPSYSSLLSNDASLSTASLSTWLFLCLSLCTNNASFARSLCGHLAPPHSRSRAMRDSSVHVSLHSRIHRPIQPERC